MERRPRNDHTVLARPQLLVLSAIMALRQERGMPPTIREICKRIKRAYSNVHRQLVNLKQLGLIEQTGNRTIIARVRLEVANDRR